MKDRGGQNAPAGEKDRQRAHPEADHQEDAGPDFPDRRRIDEDRRNAVGLHVGLDLDGRSKLADPRDQEQQRHQHARGRIDLVRH
jgi:hypothetical protein